MNHITYSSSHLSIVCWIGLLLDLSFGIWTLLSVLTERMSDATGFIYIIAFLIFGAFFAIGADHE
jgi:hypothetical protein